MKIVLSTDSMISAVRLKGAILRAVKGENADISIETWSYVRTSDIFDVLYHINEEYVNDPTKNVLFKVVQDGNDVLLTVAWWKRNPDPSWEIRSLHVGRLVELLLTYFKNKFISFKIVDFN